MPDNNNNSNKKNIVSSITTTTESLAEIEGKRQEQHLQQPVKDGQQQDHSHKGENCHSKDTEKELDNEHLKSELKVMKEELKKHKEEQKTLLKENKQTLIDFIIDKKELIRVEDLKIYEPVYKCYREKGNCHICNSLSKLL